MLIDNLNKINEILNQLILITKEDIESIKKANHNKIFANIELKENLAKEFEKLKSKIDEILTSRNRAIEEIFSPKEEEEFEKFKKNLNEFYKYHKHFSRLCMTVSNFYDDLLNKIKDKKKLTYDKDCNPNPRLKLKA